MAPQQRGDETMVVRLVSCRNDAGVRLAARLLRRYGNGQIILADDDTPTPDCAVILCPPTCDT
jgi:hypothetical protein